jgi:hypothetical protein
VVVVSKENHWRTILGMYDRKPANFKHGFIAAFNRDLYSRKPDCVDKIDYDPDDYSRIPNASAVAELLECDCQSAADDEYLKEKYPNIFINSTSSLKVLEECLEEVGTKMSV